MTEKLNEAVIPSSIKQAILDTFRVQVGISTEVGNVATQAGGNAEKDLIDCISVLGMKCSGFSGSLALGFPEKTFLGVVGKMLGEEYKEISNENADACSELLNIIYASARVKINEAGYDFQPAIPSTIRGKNLSVAMGNSSKYLKFCCESEKGPFFIGFYLRKTKE